MTCSKCGLAFIAPARRGAGRPRTRCDGCRSNQERNDGKAWREMRARVLVEEPYCYQCGDVATEVDHIVPLSLDPALGRERSNLRGACKSCNASKGARLDDGTTAPQAYRRRSLAPDPCTCPPDCHCQRREPHQRHWCL